MNKESHLKKAYRDCKNYIIESKYYFVISLAIFCLSIIIGFGLPIFYRVEIIDFLKGLVDVFAGKNLIQTILMIFYNNAKVSLFVIVSGILVGIIPFVVIIVNGYVIGFVTRIAVEEMGILVLWRLIPHGIFELPAVLISVGLGIKIGMSLFNKKRGTKNEIIRSLRFFFLVILPILLIAAIIEGLLVFYVK